MKTQLRVRTEYSFGEVYGPLDSVITALKEQGATSAGMVELHGGTWGHVQWSAKCRAAGILPMFGAEVMLPESETHRHPVAWVLARDISAFYRFTSQANETKVSAGRGQRSSATVTNDALAAARGKLIRFSGSALDDPETFDFIDLNPASILQQRRALALHKKTKKPLVITSDNAYPVPDDLDKFLLVGSNRKPTYQHLLFGQPEELELAFPEINTRQIAAAIAIADEIAQDLKDTALRVAPLISVEGDLRKLCKAGIKKRLASRQISEWTDAYQARLEHELKVIREKNFDSYFLVVSDMVRWAKRTMIVGPARGSAAGSLVCYLTEITEIDPIPYGLIFERFVDVTRKDLPDIDLDFPDTDRDSVYVYLSEKYGTANVARIGTINTFKPLSALNVAAKNLGINPGETYPVKNAMFVRTSGDSRANNCLIDTLRETLPGKSLLEKYPALELASAIESHASHTGVHAAGVCVCNEPISNFCTVEEGVAQIDKIDAEPLNLLKIDALGLRTLGILQDSKAVTQSDLYNLKLDDPAVFKIIRDRKYAGVFQWEGQALQGITNQLGILDRFSDLEQITAIARPGPLGGGAVNHFVARRRGTEQWTYPHPSMAQYLDESFGLVLYQEQVLRMCREIGNMSWDDVTLLRKAMSKSYGKEYFDKFGEKFIAGADTHSIKKRDAQAMWDQINSMGSWAFNKSHSVSYAVVSYWTAWMKAYHPLEYAAAALRGARDEASAVDLLRELHSEGISYVAFDIDRSETTWSVQDGQLLGGWTNIKGIGPAKAAAFLEKRAAGKLTEKDRDRIALMDVKFRDLYPLHTLYAEAFENPASVGVRDGDRLTQLRELPEEGEVVVLARVVDKDLRDENETTRVAKRNGRVIRGETVFADFSLIDDSTSAHIILRVDRHDYEPSGRLMMERLETGKEVLLIRARKIKNFPMLKFIKAKSLTNPKLFKE